MEPATIQYQVCHPGTSVQNGKEPDRQGYKCKSGDCSFVIGDSAINPSVELKRYTAVLFYSLGKTSFHFLAQLFDLSAATIYQWIGLTAETVGTPVVAAGIEEIEIDHRWHFLSVKKPKDGSSRRWMVTAAELSAGLSLVVMGQGWRDWTASWKSWVNACSRLTTGMIEPKCCRPSST